VDVERTRDIVHTSLIQEVAELDGVCSNLTEELENMQDELEELRQVEGMLEEDLAMKTKSIQIDEKCMKLRCAAPHLWRHAAAVRLGACPHSVRAGNRIQPWG